MIDPFLFDGLAADEAIPETPAPVYTSPIEQATFDIMEEVDSFFRASITVEEYDAVQKKVKKFVTEAVNGKKDPPDPSKRSVIRSLLRMRDDA